MNDTVVAIVSAFFVIGILVGIIAVVAMSVSGPSGEAIQEICWTTRPANGPVSLG